MPSNKTKQLKLAIQMDAIDTIKVASDSSYLLGLAAQDLGIKLYYYQPKDMFYENGKVFAYLSELKLFLDNEHFYELKEINKVDLSSMDIILIRQDPPFNMDYLTYTYLLDLIADKVSIVNDQSTLRNFPEKLIPLHFKELIPPTLITKNVDAAIDFKKQHKEIIIKPLYGHGGEGIVKSGQNDTNLIALFEIYIKQYQCPMLIQPFLKAVEKGDKRIILVNGEICGAIKRIPQSGEIRTNLARGGSAFKTNITKNDLKIVDKLKPFLVKHNILLAGIDIIGNYLIEVNITSPTGLKAVNNLDDIWPQKIFMQKLLQQIKR